MPELIPVHIRPHLVSFLFKELEGKEASYMNTKSKTIKIYPFSSLGKILYSQLVNHIKIGRNDQYLIFLSIEKKRNLEFQGQLCMEVKKLYENLLLPEPNVRNINNLLEDIFRIAFIYYVQGCLEHDKEANVTKAIERFIDKYELLEAGFSNETLRRLYYREKSKNKHLSRLQNQSSNQVTNFKTMSQ
jgi:hypothetical protein